MATTITAPGLIVNGGSNTSTITMPNVVVTANTAGGGFSTNFGRVTTTKEAIAATSRFAALTDVVPPTSSGSVEYDANTQVFTVRAGDSSVAQSSVNGSNVSINWDTGGVYRLTLTANTQLTSTGVRNKVILQVQQNPAGNHDLVFDATHELGDLAGFIDHRPSSTTYIGMIYNPTTSKYDVVSFVTGY